MAQGQARRPMDNASGDMRYRSMNMGASPYGSRPAQGKNIQQPERTERQPQQPCNGPAAVQSMQNRSAGGIDMGKLLGGVKLDEEKVIIIFLIIILARNGAELPLLAALGYLLM